MIKSTSSAPAPEQAEIHRHVQDRVAQAQQLVDTRPRGPVAPEWLHAANHFGDLSVVALEFVARQ